MTATTDANWAPLEARLSDDVDVIREFMWMYGDEGHSASSITSTQLRAVTCSFIADGRCFQQSRKWPGRSRLSAGAASGSRT